MRDVCKFFLSGKRFLYSINTILKLQLLFCLTNSIWTVECRKRRHYLKLNVFRPFIMRNKKSLTAWTCCNFRFGGKGPTITGFWACSVWSLILIKALMFSFYIAFFFIYYCKSCVSSHKWFVFSSVKFFFFSISVSVYFGV